MTREERRVSSPRVVNIADLRLIAQRRLPQVAFDYVDGGAEGEITMRGNCRAFEEVTFRPHHAVAVSRCDMHITVLGCEISMPFLLAPIGFSRMLHPQGEVGGAIAAGKAGIGFVLTTMAGHKLEDVAKATTGPLWYQLYLCGGRGAAEAALERARNAGFKVLAITIDTSTFGMRERDVRNGAGILMGTDRFAKIPLLPNLLAHPGWFAGFIADGMFLELPNIVPEAGGKCLALSEAQKGLANSVVTWNDLKWLRKAWPGPIVVKGVLTSDDARRSVDEGAAGIVVSNHGGRQLDSVAATLRALPEIVKAVGQQAEILMDGGIRRGGDIIKALCLGARAVLVGRAYAYGLGAAGAAGASRAVEILRADLTRTMALLGCESIKDLNASYVEVPASWPVKPS